MSSPTQNKPGGKPGQVSKPDQQRGQKPVQPLNLKAKPPQSQKPEQVQPVQQPSRNPVQQQSPKPAQQPSPTPVQQQSPKPVQQPSLTPVQPQSPKPVQQQDGKKQFDAALASANTLSIDFQTIATAYGDYSKKSFEQTKAFVEKLSRAGAPKRRAIYNPTLPSRPTNLTYRVAED